MANYVKNIIKFNTNQSREQGQIKINLNPIEMIEWTDYIDNK